MNWADITILVLLGVGLLFSAYYHGESKPDYNIWVSLLSTAIWLFLFYKAGMFN